MTVKHSSAVLFLLGTLETGGSEAKFVRLAQRLKKQQKSIHVAYLGPPENLLPGLEGIPVVNLGRRGKWSLRAYRALSRYVEEHSIVSIVAVNFYPLAYAIPLIVLRPTSVAQVVVSVNTSEIQSSRERLFMRVYVPLLKRCEQIIFGSKRQQQDWLRMYGLPEARSSVIYNGVDGSYFDPRGVEESRDTIRASLDIESDATVIICVGRLRPEKAHCNLLQAAAILEKKYELTPEIIFVGDGEERAAIIHCAERLGIRGRLHMTGSMNDVRPYLNASDLFVLTSTAVETFSNAALEASAMGLPVIISDVGGSMEMFPAGSSGTIYPRNDIEALAGALASKLQMVKSDEFDEDDARRRILRNFSVNAMDSAWTKVIWKNCDSENSRAHSTMIDRGEH